MDRKITAVPAGSAVLLGLLIAAACGPGRPAASTRPAVDIASLQKDIVVKLAGAAETVDLAYLANVTALVVRVMKALARI